MVVLEGKPPNCSMQPTEDVAAMVNAHSKHISSSVPLRAVTEVGYHFTSVHPKLRLKEHK